jgi:hypothetical protein
LTLFEKSVPIGVILFVFDGKTNGPFRQYKFTTSKTFNSDYSSAKTSAMGEGDRTASGSVLSWTWGIVNMEAKAITPKMTKAPHQALRWK